LKTYQKLCTLFYEADKPFADPIALAFYTKYAVEANGPILEPMCGSGRFLIPLLQSGFDIDGTDISPEMLQVCRRKAEEAKLTVNLYEQPLHQIDLPRLYGLIFICSGSFSLITDPDEIVTSLQKMHDCLSPGGKLVVEVQQLKDQPSSSWPWAGRWIILPNDERIIVSWLGNYDAVTQISRSMLKYEHVGQNGSLITTEFQPFDLRSYAIDEFGDLLAQAGFAEIRCFTPHGEQPPNATDEEIVFEAIRP